jgi:hypothetical protein
MTLSEFIKANNIRPADAIVVRKQFISLLDHYLIYLGIQNGEHKFIANYTKGTQILSYDELREFSSEFKVSRIRRFIGNEIQRTAAVSRALSRKDQISYNLIYNNCEHYANYIQTGKDSSQQSQVFGATLTMAGLVGAASSKSDSGKAIGLIAAALGLITLIKDSNK